MATLFSPPQPAAVTPSPVKRSRRGLILPTVLAVALIGAGGYGFTQHNQATDLAKDVSSAKSSLAHTRTDLASAEDERDVAQNDLDTAKSDLSAAEDQLVVCDDVGRAAQRMFNSTGSLLTYASALLDGNLNDPGLTKAGNDIDAVSTLVDNNGYESIQDLIAGCTGTGGSTT